MHARGTRGSVCSKIKAFSKTSYVARGPLRPATRLTRSIIGHVSPDDDILAFDVQLHSRFGVSRHHRDAFEAKFYTPNVT